MPRDTLSHVSVSRHTQAHEISASSWTVTVVEAAQLMGISRALAYAAVRRGEIPTIRIGRRLLVPRAQLLAMLEGSGRPGVEDKAEDA